MNYLDIIICIPLAWALFKGFRKGFILEIASLISLILGIYIAFKFSYFAADLLKKYLTIQNEALPLISFIVTFLAVVIGIHFLAKILEKVLKLAALGLVNKLAGALFSFLKVALIISVIIYCSSILGDTFNIIPPEIKEESLVYEPIKKVPPKILPLLKNLEIKEHIPYFDSDSIPELP